MKTIIRLVALLSASATGFSQTNTTDAPKPAKPVASTGLLNDWLRKDWSAAKAWDFGGQVRLRFDSKENAGVAAANDFIRALSNDNEYLWARVRLHAGYTPTKWLRLFAQAQHAATSGDGRALHPDDNEIDLYQAWLELGPFESLPLRLKLGRQELAYGDERFVGKGEWGNGRTFDAARLRYDHAAFMADAFVGRVVLQRDKHFDVANDYDVFSGIYVSTKKLCPLQETDFFFLARNVGVNSPNALALGAGGPTSRDVYTLGTRIKSLPDKLGPWDYSAEIAVQFGNVTSGGVQRTLEAWMFDATAGRTWKNAWGSPRVGVGYTFGSGDGNPADGKVETFELLFGTNHRLYGQADVVGLRNMHSPSVNVSVKPLKTLTVRAEFLLFWLADGNDFFYPESGAGRAANGYGRNPQFGRYVGSELDIVANYAATKWLNVQAGFGHFFVGDYIKQSVGSVPANGGAVDSNWFYLQGVVNF
jgi:hypothetical protein